MESDNGIQSPKEDESITRNHSQSPTDGEASRGANGGMSVVARATICFTRERSLSSRLSSDNDGQVDGRENRDGNDNDISDVMTALLSNLTPDSNPPSPRSRREESAFHATLGKPMSSMTLHDLYALIGHEIDKKSEMQQRLEATESQLSAAKKQNGELAEKLSQMQAANVALINQVCKLLERLDVKDCLLSNAQAEKDEMNITITSLRGDVESLHHQLNDSQANQNYIESELEQHLTNLIKATSQESGEDEESIIIANLKNELKGDVAAFNSTVTSLHREIESQSQQSDECQATHTGIEEFELHRVHTKLMEELQQYVATLVKATVHENEKDSITIANLKNELVGDVAALNPTITSPHRDIESREQLDECLATQTGTESELHQVQAKLIGATSKFNEENSEKGGLAQNVTTFEAPTDCEKSEPQEAKSNCQHAASAFAPSQSTAASLQSNIDRKLAEMEPLRERPNSKREHGEERLAPATKIDLDDVITDLEAEIRNGYWGPQEC